MANILSRVKRMLFGYPRIELNRNTIRSPCCHAFLENENTSYTILHMRCVECNRPYCKRYNESQNKVTSRLSGQMVQRNGGNWEVIKSATLQNGEYIVETREGDVFKMEPDNHGKWREK